MSPRSPRSGKKETDPTQTADDAAEAPAFRKRATMKDMVRGGRPSSYRAEYAEQAFKRCLLGATNKELASYFEVDEATIATWNLKHPKFLNAIKDGRDKADAEVANKMYQRAIGYEHTVEKVVTVSKGNGEGSETEVVSYTERLPPDTTAAMFWLKNRHTAQWRDRSTLGLENANDDGEPFKLLIEFVNPAKPASEG